MKSATERTSFIGSECLLTLEQRRTQPCPSAKPVFWYIDHQWVHKGWLMPEVK